jgi:4-aminobutyrate aminotransferase-like enzyme
MVELVERDEVLKKYKKYILKNVVEPIVPYEGEGAILKDLDGKEYLDFTTGYSVMALGYGNSLVKKKIIEQLTKLEHCCHYLFFSIQAANLAEKLCEITPGKLQKSFLCNSGSEAIEGAIRLARKYTGRHEIFALFRSHHGRTMGAASITGNYIEKRGMGPYLAGVHFLPPPYCFRCSLKQAYPECDIACAEFMEEALKYSTCNDVACIVIEPIMMDVVIVPPDGYLERVKRICEENDILFIADEVQSGLGRSGMMFAVEHWKIEPDLMALGKSLGGGLPLGAFIASERVAGAFEDMDFASSCGGNPLACVAGLEVINQLQNGLVKNSNVMGKYFIERLQELKDEHELIGEVRGRGLFIGLELIRDQKTKIPAIKEAERVKNLLREKGLLLIRNESTFRILPPLTINRGDIDKAVDLIDDALKEIKKM